MIEFEPALKSVLSLFACLILTSCTTVATHYFSLQFVDSETGQGIPLVEMETTNRIR